jgi:hypothetical protein
MSIRKLTPALLRRIVLEERSRVLREKSEKLVKDPVEVEADEYADTLESHEDFTVSEAKNMIRRIEMMERDEKALVRKLRQIREAKSRAVRKLRK